jgi:hypothetical protein
MNKNLTNDSEAMARLMKMLGISNKHVTQFELRVHHDKIPKITVTSEVYDGNILTEETVTQEFELVAIESKKEQEIKDGSIG